MNEKVLYKIYGNILKMTEYRKMTVKNIYTKDEFIKKINSDEYILINCFNNINHTTINKNDTTINKNDTTINKNDTVNNDNTMVVLFMPGSKYSLKSPDFEKLLNNINKNNKTANMVSNYMFVSETEFSTHIIKKIEVFRSINENVNLEHYTYKLFIVEIPKCVMVPKHEFATEEEIKICIYDRYKTLKDLPKILITDPPIVWIGGKASDIIKITRISETAGYAIVYKIVVK